MQNQKTYMWLAIITFLALAVGLAASYIHLQEYQDGSDVATYNRNIFK